MNRSVSNVGSIRMSRQESTMTVATTAGSVSQKGRSNNKSYDERKCETSGGSILVIPSGATIQRLQCFKTKRCRFWMEGRCNRGDACTYAHTDIELRSPPDLTKTKLCTRWKRGTCEKSADDCAYAHGLEDLRETNNLSPINMTPSTTASRNSVEEETDFPDDDDSTGDTDTDDSAGAITGGLSPAASSTTEPIPTGSSLPAENEDEDDDDVESRCQLLNGISEISIMNDELLLHDEGIINNVKSVQRDSSNIIIGLSDIRRSISDESIIQNYHPDFLTETYFD